MTELNILNDEYPFTRLQQIDIGLDLVRSISPEVRHKSC